MQYYRIDRKIVPYTRMTQRGKHIKADALRYLASQDQLRWEIKQQMSLHGYEMLPDRTPLHLNLVFYGYGHNMDLSNLLKAVEDGLQTLVFADDRWIDSVTALRYPKHDGSVLTIGCGALA